MFSKYTFLSFIPLSLVGILTAILLYRKGPLSEKWEQRLCYKILINQYYIPKIYDEVFSKPYLALSKIAWKQIDLKIVDATVDTIAHAIYKTGENTRDIQNGNLSTMLRWMQ